MEALEMLRTRRSVRKFTNQEVTGEQIETLVDAGRLASTARNQQPWEFVVVTDPTMRAKIASITEHGKFIADAPLCIVVVCRDGKYFLEDGSAATQNILLAARALGLGSCWVAGDKKPYADNIRRLLGAPDGYKLVSMIAVGYEAVKPTMPSKRSIEEVLHRERF